MTTEQWLLQWQRTAVRVVMFTRARRPWDVNLHRRRRPHWSLHAVVQGQLELRSSGFSMDAKPGDVVVMPPATAFQSRGRDQQGFNVVIIELQTMPALGGPDPLHCLGQPDPQSLGVDSLRKHADAIERCWRTMQNGDLASRLHLRPLVERLLADWLNVGLSTALPHAQAVPAWLSTLRRNAILVRPGCGGTVAALAQQAGCSPAQLTRQWRQHFGCGVITDIKEERLALAARDLAADPECGVQVIAQRYGWQQRRQFTREFSRRFGTSPQAWRSARPGTA